MLYVFKCRDGEVIIPKKQFETFLNIDWFITNLIKYSEETDKDNHKIIELYESKNAVLTLFDSIRFNKLILHDESIDYIISLSDYWCAPKWLITELELVKERETNNTNTFLDSYPNQNLNQNPIVECKLCRMGFKLKENSCTSCKRHLYSINNGTLKFACCGRGPNEECCSIGYHIPNL